MNVDKRKNILCILAAIGFITTIELAVVFYQANYNPYAEPSFCAINDFADCDFMAQTTKSVFLGVPLAYWGLFFYLFVFMLLYSDKLSGIKGLKMLRVFKNPFSYISVLGLVSFVISIMLALLSIFYIQKICILCFVTYFINLALAIAATDFACGGLKKSFADSFSDFIIGVKEYPIRFAAVVIIVGVFLSYTTIYMPFASKKQSVRHYIEMKSNPYKVSGNILGNIKGSRRVDLYSDFACPICPSYNIMLHKIVHTNKEVLIVHHNLPLDIECNPYLEYQMHKGACRMARYSIAAENQGKYWDMANLLFENKPQNDKEAIELALTLNLDITKFVYDINSAETKSRIKREIDEAIAEGIDGTPTLKAGGRYIYGVKPYYEIKKVIIED